MGAAEKLNEPAPGLVLNALFANPALMAMFTQAIVDTLHGFTQVQVQPGQARRETSAPKGQKFFGAATIRLEGLPTGIELMLAFDRESFEVIYGQIFQTPSDIPGDAASLAGEILNVAFGAIREKLAEKGYKSRYSLPCCYYGQELERFVAACDPQRIVLPFVYENRSFAIEIFAGGSLQSAWKFSPS